MEQKEEGKNKGKLHWILIALRSVAISVLAFLSKNGRKILTGLGVAIVILAALAFAGVELKIIDLGGGDWSYVGQDGRIYQRSGKLAYQGISPQAKGDDFKNDLGNVFSYGESFAILMEPFREVDSGLFQAGMTIFVAVGTLFFGWITIVWLKKRKLRVPAWGFLAVVANTSAVGTLGFGNIDSWIASAAVGTLLTLQNQSWLMTGLLAEVMLDTKPFWLVIPVFYCLGAKQLRLLAQSVGAELGWHLIINLPLILFTSNGWFNYWDRYRALLERAGKIMVVLGAWGENSTIQVSTNLFGPGTIANIVASLTNWTVVVVMVILFVQILRKQSPDPTRDGVSFALLGGVGIWILQPQLEYYAFMPFVLIYCWVTTQNKWARGLALLSIPYIIALYTTLSGVANLIDSPALLLGLLGEFFALAVIIIEQRQPAEVKAPIPAANAVQT